MLAADFGRVAGCDPSTGMLGATAGFETREQTSPTRIPFGDGEFDFVTAVCVYHHVSPGERAELTADVVRVLKPGGTFCIIEHNPYNPATRLIVSRTPVDADAILLRPAETRALQQGAGLRVQEQPYFLYLPEPLYKHLAWLEGWLSGVPLGGQYATFGERVE